MIKRFLTVCLLSAGASLMFPQQLEAAIRLHGYLSDNMVVQRDAEMNVTGVAGKNAKVVVSPGWSDQKYEGVADAEGKFSVKIPTPPAGGPYRIDVKSGSDKKAIRNILSGDVWVCSGQSNMEFPVKGWSTVMNDDEVINKAIQPDIRLFQVKRTMSLVPKDDCSAENGGWTECNPSTVQPFSAVGYLFAKELRDSVRVPIGIVNASWGGTPAEAWTSLEGVRKSPGFDDDIHLMESNAFDPDKMTLKKNEELMTAAREYIDNKGSLEWKPIPVGKYWEDSVLPKFDGIVLLKKKFNIPANMAGKQLELRLGGLKDFDVTKFNGKEVGRGRGHKSPRVYVVPPEMVKSGDAEIEVMVINYHGYGGFAAKNKPVAVGASGEILLSDGWEYTPVLNFKKMKNKPVAPYSKYYPTALYNTMIRPLAPMTVKGVIWYQGCANYGRDQQYGPLIKNMIGDWRKQWGENMPFYFVQLAGYGKPAYCTPNALYGALREAQTKALELDNTAMAVAVDLGNPDDIHPRDKQSVAHRLALIALNRDYGKNVNYVAPRCTSMKTENGNLILGFDKPLQPTSCAVTGFIIAGNDGKYTEAAGKLINDRTVQLSSSLIKNPTQVKYNWAAYPSGNLYGVDGLPVAPFQKK